MVFASADVYLGAGFDRVDPVVMDQQKIMYSVSRHLAPEPCGRKRINKWNRPYLFKDMCQEYKGSHDVFLFRLHQPLPEEFLQKLKFDAVRYGAEARMIWLFKNVLKYCVLNPCTILETFHHHCSGLRTNINKPRLEERDMALARPSNSLLCTPVEIF